MRAKPVGSYTCVPVALAILTLSAPAAQPDLVVHEWGTFTSLQDENGTAIGGINTDDEPVPAFVHRVSNFLLLPHTELPPVFFKGTPYCNPEVTMRLETPVVYFHPAASTPGVSTLDLQVRFIGGWLSEYFPMAAAVTPGLTSNGYNHGPLDPATVSSLAWQNLQVGGAWSGPPSKAHVWTSPRAVDAANVRTTNGEAERFLFYRGVAHLNAPLKISSRNGELTFRSQLDAALAEKCSLPIRSLWLVDIHPDGKLAFKTLPPLTLDGDQGKVLATISSQFQPGDYQARHLEELRQSLHTALLSEGLFADEAQALLNTWESSYFKSTGLRVFFLVPRTWTDAVLPIEISTRAKIERAMVGRIELVSSTQHQLLTELSKCTFQKTTNGAMQLLTQAYQPSVINAHWQKLNTGEESLNEAGLSVPDPYAVYLRLGRFRQALVLDEQARHPSTNLQAFIDAYRLGNYRLQTQGVLRATESLPQQAAH